MKKQFTFISICGGIGMGSEALKQLGGVEIACVDNGDLQEKAHNILNPDGVFLKKDVRKVTPKNLNEFLISRGKAPIEQVDLILFSTPCTYASGLNYYRTPHAEMNQLTSVEIPRILEQFAPKIGFIAENVPDIITDKALRPMFKALKRKLKAADMYDIDVKILDSADYNCWTSRPRGIFFGKSKFIPGSITFPAPTTRCYADYYLNKLIPTALLYSPGLYRKKTFSDSDMLIGKRDNWLSADRILGTVTATGGEMIMDSNFSSERQLTIDELKTIFGIEHFDFTGLTNREIHFLIGNGIVVPFLKTVTEHFLEQFYYSEKN